MSFKRVKNEPQIAIFRLKETCYNMYSMKCITKQFVLHVMTKFVILIFCKNIAPPLSLSYKQCLLVLRSFSFSAIIVYLGAIQITKSIQFQYRGIHFSRHFTPFYSKLRSRIYFVLFRSFLSYFLILFCVSFLCIPIAGLLRKRISFLVQVRNGV